MDAAAEAWLREHDPEYEQRSKDWRPTKVDALEHIRSRADRHPTLTDLSSIEELPRPLAPGMRGVPAPIGSGNYRRRKIGLAEDEGGGSGNLGG